MTRIHTVRYGVVVLFIWCIANGCLAAPDAKLWKKWQSSDPQSSATIDHSRWQVLLDRYLKQSGNPLVTLFDYQSVRKQDQQQLQEYIEYLVTRTPATYSRAVQKAYWINLYNALTVKLVLDHYPVESIRKIRFGWFSFGPWDEKLIEVDGDRISLNDIEHRILRPIWKDPRIHYAVNCASIGCPNLAPQAYTADNMEQLLEQGSRHYINHPRGVRFEGDSLVLSSIYDWYQTDFGGSLSALKNHLRRYANSGLRARLDSHESSVTYHYDWRLNSP